MDAITAEVGYYHLLNTNQHSLAPKRKLPKLRNQRASEVQISLHQKRNENESTIITPTVGVALRPHR